MLATAIERNPIGAVQVFDPSFTAKTEVLERIARSSINVLVRGETGTGKEVLARTVHDLSLRSGELLAINCASLTAPLLEKMFDVAGQGSILLDEVGELSLDLQSMLLRALEAPTFRIHGATELRARVIATSHRVMPELLARGRFREDLYFRLNGITLELVPLRDRRAQIPQLANEFLAEASSGSMQFTPAALEVLDQHDWPGNVRELRVVVVRAALLAESNIVDAHHVLVEPRATITDSASGIEAPRDGFVAVASEYRGNASAIARALSTSRSQVRRLAARFGVDLEQLRRS